MSALPIIETQKSQAVGLLTTNKERELGSDRPETGYFYRADAIVIASICEATMRGTHSSDDVVDDDDVDADDAEDHDLDDELHARQQGTRVGFRPS